MVLVLQISYKKRPADFKWLVVNYNTQHGMNNIHICIFHGIYNCISEYILVNFYGKQSIIYTFPQHPNHKALLATGQDQYKCF